MKRLGKSRRVWQSLSFIYLLLVSLQFGTAQRPPGRSLKPEIQRLQQQLAKLDGEILEDQNADLRLVIKIADDLIPGSAAVQFLQLEQHVDLVKALDRGEYSQALSNALEELNGFFGKESSRMPEYLSNALAKGITKGDAVADLADLYLVLQTRAQAVGIRDQAFVQLLRLQSKDPEALANWRKISDNLHGNAQAAHQDFLQWLKKNDVNATALVHQASAEKERLGRGISIVDPDEGINELAKDPSINPDFIASLKRCAEVARRAFTYRGWYEDAMSCDKYSDGTYIPAFGPTGQRKLAALSPAFQASFNGRTSLAGEASRAENGSYPKGAPATRSALSIKQGKPGLLVHWNGANMVNVEIVDSTQKFRLGGFFCGDNWGKICRHNMAPGNYFLKFDSPGFEHLLPVNVNAAEVTEITPPVGVLNLHWPGENLVTVEVVDSTQKFKLGSFFCGDNWGKVCKHDVASGVYFLKFNTPGLENLIAVSVNAAAPTDITPTVGTLAMHWTGVNLVSVGIVDSTKKFRLGGFFCGDNWGQTCKHDVAAGDYYLAFSVPGFENLIPFHVNPSETSGITPPVGTINLHWSGAKMVNVGVVDSMQKYRLGGFFCGEDWGNICKQDAAAGSYFLQINTGYEQLLPIVVNPGRLADVTR